MENKQIKQKRPKTNKIKVVLYTFAMLVINGAIIVSAIGGYYVFNLINSSQEPFDANRLFKEDSSRIFAADGSLIDELGARKRENIEYDDIPQVMIDAILSIEDSRYFEHSGFDIPRMIKAGVSFVVKDRFNGAGGSTITQQMIKDAYFPRALFEKEEEKIERKVKEIYLAIQADEQLSKEDILMLYLNGIWFGDNAYGIQKASKSYFGKNASELTLPEAAMLAGIINKPFAYNPRLHLDKATIRRNEVLDAMVYHGYISEAEAEAAASIGLETMLVQRGSDEVINPYQAYLDVAIEQVKEETGRDPATSPMDIYTFLDINAQLNINQIMAGTNPNVPDFMDPYFDSAFAVQEATTGRLVAIAGGRRYQQVAGERLHNLAYSEPQSPGSSIKPILDYAPAFDNLGISTGHYFIDAPIKIGNWSPNNAIQSFVGEISMQDAFGRSLNTPAINLFVEVEKKIGNKAFLDQFHSFGFEQNSNAESINFAYSIGGFLIGATPIQMGGALAAIANNGVYIKPHTINYVVYNDRFGVRTQQIDAEMETKQIYSPAAAYMTADLMRNTVTSNYLNLGMLQVPGVPTYAKSGTSDWGDGNAEFGIPPVAAKDRWAVGFTPDYVVAVWTGYSKLSHDVERPWIDTWSGLKHELVNYIFKETMAYMHRDGSYTREITKPDSVVSASFVKGSWPYLVPDDNTPADMISTGLFNSAFPLPSKKAEAPKVSDLNDFSASLNGRSINFNFAAYEPNEMTKPPANTNKVNEGGGLVKTDDDLLKKIYGTIDYYVVLKNASGNYVSSPTGVGSTSGSINVPNDVYYGKDFSICGYYGLNKATNVRSGEICRSFKVNDSTPPVISNYASSFKFKPTFTMNDIKSKILSGVSANDEFDGNVSSSLEVIGQFDPSVPGTYTVYLRASDSSGNQTNDSSYTIKVVIESK